MTVAIIGASNSVERYSYKCMKKLEENGHRVFLIAKKTDDIEGKKVVASLSQIDEKIDTVTVYVSSKHQESTISDILKIKPRRVIFNPGTENPEAYENLKANNIEVIEACSLVLLSTNQF